MPSMSIRLLAVAAFVLASGGSSLAAPPPAGPTARAVVERQLAKPAPAPTGGLSVREAQEIRDRYLKRIGSAPLQPGSQETAPPR